MTTEADDYAAKHFDEVSDELEAAERELAELRDELEALRRQLAEAQAREARYRAALIGARDLFIMAAARRGRRQRKLASQVDEIIATKPDDAALREFGLKVARAMYMGPDQPIELRERDEWIVDGVLKGGA